MYKINFQNGISKDVEWADGKIVVDGQVLNWDITPLPGGGYSVLADNKSYNLHIDSLDAREKTASILIDNHRYQVSIQEPIDLLLGKMGINLASQKKAEAIKAPMPGLVLKILVEEGQQIRKGDPVLILEAMKMENVFKAPSDAKVGSIKAVQGAAVEKGTILIELE